MFKFLAVILSLSSFLSLHAEVYLKDVAEVLKHVETNYNAEAVGDNGKAYGILQIHKSAILDVNRYFGTFYRHEDAFDVTCSEEIFYLYLSMGIDLYYKKYKKYPSKEQVVRMWNGGIYKGYKNPATKKYYSKYLKYKTIINESKRKNREDPQTVSSLEKIRSTT